jgi:hypothetical protein
MIRQSYSFGLRSAGLSDVVPGQVPADIDPAAVLAGMEIQVGVMAQSPMGREEVPDCIFSRFQMREGVRGKDRCWGRRYARLSEFESDILLLDASFISSEVFN